MPQRKKPKPEIIEYKKLKAAAGGGGRGGGGRGGGGSGSGGSGGGGGDQFRPGQSLHCKVGKEEPGGYAMVIVSHNLPGFLPTQALLRPGEDILAQFVCIHNHRILLSARFSPGNISNLSSAQTMIHDGHLIIDQSGKFPHFNNYTNPTPKRFHYKRATDLIPPAIDQASLREFKIKDHDLESLITELEEGNKTGCVKAWCKEKQSRSAILLNQGRVVGCIRSCISEPNTLSTEKSLQKMLGDLEIPAFNVQVYDLPENITLAMSALFLGYPVQRNDNYNAHDYLGYICAWLENKKSTACIAITLPSNSNTCLCYFYKGQFCGAFYVEEQQLKMNKEFVYELLTTDASANVEASILPPEMTSPAFRFGFSLSAAKKRKDTSADDIWG